MKAIGSIGPIGSGKDTVIKCISRKHKIPLISIGNIVREIAKAKGVPPTRNNLQKIAKYHIKKYGEDYFPKKVIEKIEKEGLDLVAITGIRTLADIRTFKKQYGADFILILVSTHSSRERFERLKLRGEPRDPKTWEEFLKQDENEEKIFRLSETYNLADYEIVNDGTLEELYDKVDKLAESIINIRRRKLVKRNEELNDKS